MKKIEQYKRTVRFVSMLINIILMTSLFAYIWYQYYSNEIVLPFYRKGNWMVIAVYSVIMILFTKIYGGYNIGYLKKNEAIYSQAISIVCVNFLAYCQTSLIGRFFMPVEPILILTFMDLIASLIWTFAYGKVYEKLYPPRKMIVVYGSKMASSLVSKMCVRTDKYIISESIYIDEDIDTIKQKISEYEGVIICDIHDTFRNDLLKFCFDRSIRAYLTPKISDIIIRGAEDINLFDTPLLLCRNYGLQFEDKIIKRAMDIILSLIILPFILPFMFLAAIAIKIHDKGPIIYKQKRLTINSKEFEVYKFRSMILDAEKDGIARLATDEDKRITPIGNVLRKFRIDEFPQIINVLKGDMSLVGPRPERPELTYEYLKEMPEFTFRLNVKAGLTGFAQVMGKYDTTPYDKLKMDLMYIERYSILTDLKIIIMTLKIMLFPGKTNETDKIIK